MDITGDSLSVFVLVALMIRLAGCSSNTHNGPAVRKVMFDCERGQQGPGS
jgi:hypothetical protein